MRYSGPLNFRFLLDFSSTKTRPPKDNKYVVNQKLEHVDDISFREFLVDDAHDNLKSTLYEHIIHLQNKRCV